MVAPGQKLDLSSYPGLLRWSLVHNDGTAPSAVGPMDEERREWLKEALETHMVDPAEQMKLIIKILQMSREDVTAARATLRTSTLSSVAEGSEESSEAAEQGAHGAQGSSSSSGSSDSSGVSATSVALVLSVEQEEAEWVAVKVQALRALQEWVEQIDWAADLHKLGGFKTVIELMQDRARAVRSAAMETFATVVQNNPKTQEWALELGALGVAVGNSEREASGEEAEEEQAKALLALSCQVREHDPSTVRFIKEYKGVALLLRVATRGGAEQAVKPKRKALFLLRFLTHRVPAVKAALADALAGALVQLTLARDVDLRDSALRLLAELFADRASVARISAAVRADTLLALRKYRAGALPDLDEHTPVLASELEQLIIAGPPAEAQGAAPSAAGAPAPTLDHAAEEKAVLAALHAPPPPPPPAQPPKMLTL